MEWHDTGIVLGTKPHSENNVIVELFTRNHGRHMGLVRGGTSRRQRPNLQTGNEVSADWRARLADHLGVLKIELLKPYAARIMDDRLALAGLETLCALARLLAERDPHPGLYEVFILILDHLGNESLWPGLMVRWEMELLNELGFGLDLIECAGTGARQNLAYVSPKSGRAVSLEAGEPYKDKLLALPKFLSHSEKTGNVEVEDILAGYKLTGFFLERHVLSPRGMMLPDCRIRLLNYLAASKKEQK